MVCLSLDLWVFRYPCYCLITPVYNQSGVLLTCHANLLRELQHQYYSSLREMVDINTSGITLSEPECHTPVVFQSSVNNDRATTSLLINSDVAIQIHSFRKMIQLDRNVTISEPITRSLAATEKHVVLHSCPCVRRRSLKNLMPRNNTVNIFPPKTLLSRPPMNIFLLDAEDAQQTVYYGVLICVVRHFISKRCLKYFISAL